MKERTFIIIKPDGIKKKVVGEILKRIEEQGLEILVLKTEKLAREKCFELYKNSILKFPKIKDKLLDYMTESNVILGIVEGDEAIKKVRNIRGLSDPSKSPVGSIRRDFAVEYNMEELTKQGKATKNIMHSSGTKEEFELEAKLFFGGGYEV